MGGGVGTRQTQQLQESRIEQVPHIVLGIYCWLRISKWGLGVVENLTFLPDAQIALSFCRCVSRDFWGQGRFLKIRAQILNRSERLNYMQTLPRASLKNNYPYQILIILASILTRAYNFMVKRIPRGFNIFTRKNTCYVLFLYHIYWAFTF